MWKHIKIIYFLNLQGMLYPNSHHKGICNVRCTTTLSICNTLFLPYFLGQDTIWASILLFIFDSNTWYFSNLKFKAFFCVLSKYTIPKWSTFQFYNSYLTQFYLTWVGAWWANCRPAIPDVNNLLLKSSPRTYGIPPFGTRYERMWGAATKMRESTGHLLLKL